MKLQRSAHVVVLATLMMAMTAIQYLPTADGQMTIAEGIKATYTDRSGGSSKKKKKKSSSSNSDSSTSKSDSSSSRSSHSRKKKKTRSSSKSKKSKDDSKTKSKSKDKKSRSKNKSKSKSTEDSKSKSKSKSGSGGKPKEKVSTWEYLNATSGTSGFDDDEKDFDILRELVVTVKFEELLMDPDDGGLDVITFFAPWDLAFAKLADRLGYEGDYDEEMIFSFLATAITGYAEANGTTLVEAIKDILRYHIGEPQRTDEKLREKGSISTTYKNLKLGVEVVKKGDRTMLLDESGANPKLHDKLKDIKTTNGYLHYIKSVLLPYDDIYGDGASSSASSSGDETESPTVEMEDSDDMAPTAAP